MFVLDFPNNIFYKQMYFMIATLLYFCINIYKKRIYIANLQHCTDHELYIIKEKSNKQLKINWRL